MMHVINAEGAAFATDWETDVTGFIMPMPCPYQVGDTIKTCETVNGVATGRYILATVTEGVPLSNVFVTVHQTIFQRAIQ